MMTLENLLSELAQKMGLPHLRLNSQGVVRLVFDRNIVVDVEGPRGAPVFHLITLLGSVPSEGQECLFARLLEANTFGHGTGGAVLSLDSEAGEIFLHRTFDRYCTDAEFFIGAFAAFVDAAEDWKTRLASYAQSTDGRTGEEGLNPAGVSDAAQSPSHLSPYTLGNPGFITA
ncbi:MAG: type III secretion system chaperone [Candidatus Methylacidiphilales bacterium]|nr:type III secretion system chaperone [Candidatus Methylacidiphilales bacterium]